MHDPHGEKGGPETKATQEQVADALKRSGGLKAAAARLLGVDWATVHRAVNRWPTLQNIITESREAILDEAEISLRKLVRDGNLGAICFTLKCVGKSRGWVERREHTGAEGGPMEIQNTLPLNRLSIETKRRILAELEGGEPDDVIEAQVIRESKLIAEVSEE